MQWRRMYWRGTSEQQPLSLRLLSPERPPHPTVVGLLAIGRTPTDYIGGAYVQFLRIDGLSLTDATADQKIIRGPLPDLVHRLDDVLTANIRTATDIRSGPVERRYPHYPLEALRQLTATPSCTAVTKTSSITSGAADGLVWRRPGGLQSRTQAGQERQAQDDSSSPNERPCVHR